MSVVDSAISDKFGISFISLLKYSIFVSIK
jgi:hypothetical protein